MADRPILFSGPMVRAILAGTKTQTRRVVKYIPMLGDPAAWCAAAAAQEPGWVHIVGDYRRFCPYGVPGDVLWVRETWGLRDTQPRDGPDLAHVYYRVTDGDRHDLRYQLWRPSIHMPRWACRQTLRVESVRVERLNDISEEDAIAEGFTAFQDASEERGGYAADRFAETWQNLNWKRYPWDSNPWVWVVTFAKEAAHG